MNAIIELMFIGDRIQNSTQITTLDFSDYSLVQAWFLHINRFPTTLTYLNLANVDFRGYTPGSDIQRLVNLQSLNLSNTKVEFIPKCPKSLRVLDISENDMEMACLPLLNEDIAVIANLETLVVYGNKDIILPASIPLHILLF